MLRTILKQKYIQPDNLKYGLGILNEKYKILDKKKFLSIFITKV